MRGLYFRVSEFPQQSDQRGFERAFIENPIRIVVMNFRLDLSLLAFLRIGNGRESEWN